MKYYIGATAVGDERLREQPRMAQFILQGDEPRHLAGEYTEERLRGRIERMRAKNEPIPPEYEEALKKLASGG